MKVLWEYHMGSWRNWLAQESYTFKVTGSSPVLPTDKKKILI